MKNIIGVIILLLFCCGTTVSQIAEHPFGLKKFKHTNQIPFCVPLPLDEYTEIESPGKTWRIFENKLNRLFSLTIEGSRKMFPKYNLMEYVTGRYTNDDVRQSQTILKTKTNEETGCYYETSSWAGTEYEQRFLEMIWVREKDVVTLQVQYALKDTVIWNERMEYLIQLESVCK